MPASALLLLPASLLSRARKHGHFSADGREFIITNPLTVVNLTQFGTGASFWQPRGEGLRANMTEDRDGNGGLRFVYLRDNHTGKYWSLTGAPGNKVLPGWRCQIGLGYQINQTRVNGIAASWRVFVPDVPDAVEYWTVTVTNTTKQLRRLSVFPYLEMHLTGGSTLMDFIAVIGGRYEADARAVFGINSCVKFPPTFKAFLASDTPVKGATVSRDEFLGLYGDYHDPLAVEAGNIHNPEAGTEWLAASLRHELRLKPGQTITINCLLGMTESVAQGKELIARYLAPGKPAELFAALTAPRESIRVQTGNKQFDLWMNVWLPHQLRFVARWGRVIGRGYRDILQDIFGHRLNDPAKARACLKEVFSKQFPSGKCIRAWRLPINILDLQDYAVPFLNPDDPYQPSATSATVWEHVVLAQRYLLNHLGQHTIYYGDWCDTMNGVGAKGRGESVMLSMQVKWGCDLLAELAERRASPCLSQTGRSSGGKAHLPLRGLAKEMRAASAKLAANINKHAWDGQWYIRAFDDNGLPVGSNTPPPSDNGEGRIFMNAQSWALISGVASPERAHAAVAAAQKHLNVGYGMVLNWPAFTSLKARIGQMTAMTPGFYENGSVYVHGNCFWIAALAMAGRADAAWEAFRAILPDTPNKPNTDTEPFIIPNYYIGPNVARRKQRNLYLSGWRTGSAAWLYMTGLENLLGLRAEYDGLRIAPNLPTGWKHCRVTRPYRNATYEFLIDNPTGKGKGVKAITVDGQELAGTLIPPHNDGQTHQVRVTMV